MSDVIIRAEKLGKRYRLGERERYMALRDILARSLGAPFRWFNSRKSESRTSEANGFLWALRDVSLEVKAGEVIGIIGRNGAGKSTLLKILARITKPTEGHAEIRGRMGSLLEVGTGFHPELTGRENVYLSGAILGMKKAEIERKFDEIVAFAEIEKFLDTPAKHYSSGMYVRLAFAVAAHLDPEILLVDEVLAVGDAAFQKKCLGKMEDVAKHGRTVLFVSHSLQAISTLTRRTIVINGGKFVFDGDTYSAIRHYQSLWKGGSAREYIDIDKSTGVTQAKVITSDQDGVHGFGKPLVFEFEISFKEKPKSGAFSFQIIDNEARPIAHVWLLDSEQPWSGPGRVLLRCILPSPRIYMGHYSVTTHLGDRASQQDYEVIEGICPFEVVMYGIPREYDWVPRTCTYLEEAKWLIQPSAP